jgi:hypothetical protein
MPLEGKGEYLAGEYVTPIITMWLGLTWDKKTAWV